MRDAEANAGIVLAADLDGDGYPDVVSGRYVVLNTDQDGVSTPSRSRHPRTDAEARVATDVDGDGDLDLVCAPHNNADADTNSPRRLQRRQRQLWPPEAQRQPQHRRRGRHDRHAQGPARRAARRRKRRYGTAISARNASGRGAPQLGPRRSDEQCRGAPTSWSPRWAVAPTSTTRPRHDGRPRRRPHLRRAQGDAVRGRRDRRYGGAEVVDVLVTSLTGAQGGTRDALKEHRHPVAAAAGRHLLLTVDKVYVVANVANVYPFNPSIATAVTTIDLDVAGGRGRGAFIAVGNLFGDAARLPRLTPTARRRCSTRRPAGRGRWLHRAYRPDGHGRHDRRSASATTAASCATPRSPTTARRPRGRHAPHGRHRADAHLRAGGRRRPLRRRQRRRAHLDAQRGPIAQKRHPTSTTGTVFAGVHELYASTDGTLDRTDAIVSALQV